MYCTEYSGSIGYGQTDNYIFLGGTCYIYSDGHYRIITSFDGQTIVTGSPFHRDGNDSYSRVLPYMVYGLKGYEME